MIKFNTGAVQAAQVIDNLSGIVYYRRDDSPAKAAVARMKIGDLPAGDLFVGSGFDNLLLIADRNFAEAVSQIKY